MQPATYAEREAMTEQERQRYYLLDPETYGLHEGTTVYTSHHGREGTFIKLYVVVGGRIVNITWCAAKAMGVKPRDRQGQWMIHNPVIGMDRGFDIVYRLSQTLFSGEVNEGDAGYVLRQEWL